MDAWKNAFFLQEKLFFFHKIPCFRGGYFGFSGGGGSADWHFCPLWATPPFRKKFRKNSGKTPETLSERFLEFPSRVRLGCPKPYNSRHLRLPEQFQNSLPPVWLGPPLFSEVVPERASQNRSWNSQQYWGYL